ncbi:MAG: CinA family protein, partial [Rhodoferax sp.]|nr:CinA family protein [Rhodoferax sp.]
GTVWLAVAGVGGTTAERLQLDGDRDAVRAQTVAAALVRLIQRARAVS